MNGTVRTSVLFCLCLVTIFGQEQFHGFFKFIGYINSPETSLVTDPINNNNSRSECSSQCLKGENCYFFDICKNGTLTSCYFYDNNLVSSPIVDKGACRRYELKQTCDIEYTSADAQLIWEKNDAITNMVFQRRVDGTTDFYRGWVEYENGFGDLANNFYMGNYYLYEIVKSGDYELRVDLEDQTGGWAYAAYTNFTIGGPSTSYTLEVAGFYGNAGDSLDHQNGMMFTTYDRDNDESGSNCAVTFKGAWWHRSCHYSNLNGQYGIDTPSGIIWYHWRGYYHSLVRAQMMVRRKINHQY